MVFSLIVSIIALLVVGSASLFLVDNRTKVKRLRSDLEDQETLNQNRRTNQISVLSEFANSVNNVHRSIGSNIDSLSEQLSANIAGNERLFNNVNRNHRNFRGTTLRKFGEINNDIGSIRSNIEVHRGLIQRNNTASETRDTALDSKIYFANSNIIDNALSIHSLSNVIGHHSNLLTSFEDRITSTLSLVVANANLSEGSASTLMTSIDNLTSDRDTKLKGVADNVSGFFNTDTNITYADFNDAGNTLNFDGYMKTKYLDKYYYTDDSVATLDDFFGVMKVTKDDSASLKAWKSSVDENVGTISDLNTNVSDLLTFKTTTNSRLSVVEQNVGDNLEKINTNLTSVLSDKASFDTLAESLVDAQGKTLWASAADLTETDAIVSALSTYKAVNADTMTRMSTLKNNHSYIQDNRNNADVDKFVMYDTVFSNQDVTDGNGVVTKEGGIITIGDMRDMKDEIDTIKINNGVVNRSLGDLFRVTDGDAGGTNRKEATDNTWGNLGKHTENDRHLHIETVVNAQKDARFLSDVQFDKNVSFNGGSDTVLNTGNAKLVTKTLQLSDGVDNVFVDEGTTTLNDYLNANYLRNAVNPSEGEDTSENYATQGYVTSTLADYYNKSGVETKIDDTVKDYVRTDNNKWSDYTSYIHPNINYASTGLPNSIVTGPHIEMNADFVMKNNASADALEVKNNLNVSDFGKIYKVEPGKVTQTLPDYINSALSLSTVLKTDTDDANYLKSDQIMVGTQNNEIVFKTNKPTAASQTDTQQSIDLDPLPVVVKANATALQSQETSDAMTNLINNKMDSTAYRRTASFIPLVEKSRSGTGTAFTMPFQDDVGTSQFSLEISSETLGQDNTVYPVLKLCDAGNRCYKVWHEGNAQPPDPAAR